MAYQNRKIFKGEVIRKRPKTIIISFNHWYSHPIYKKKIFKTKTFHCHDEFEKCDVGDIVLIRQSRKHSAMKFFELHKIIEKVNLEKHKKTQKK